MALTPEELKALNKKVREGMAANKEAKPYHKRLLDQGHTPEEAKQMTFDLFPQANPHRGSQTIKYQEELTPQKELLEKNKTQQYQMGEQERIDQIQIFETMVKIRLKEVAMQEYKQMQEKKTLQRFTRNTAESMIELMETLMEQGSNRIEAREVATQYYIVEM